MKILGFHNQGRSLFLGVSTTKSGYYKLLKLSSKHRRSTSNTIDVCEPTIGQSDFTTEYELVDQHFHPYNEVKNWIISWVTTKEVTLPGSQGWTIF